jgi:signal transduction histidine kinase
VGPEGLPAALADLAIRVATIYGLDCRFEGEQTVAVNDELAATQLFRIAQEALRNAAEHSGANRIAVSLRQEDGKVSLEVRDNGRGFPDNQARFSGAGLRIMRYRANLIGAALEIAPADGQGTRLRCVLPGRRELHLPLSSGTNQMTDETTTMTPKTGQQND